MQYTLFLQCNEFKSNNSEKPIRINKIKNYLLFVENDTN